MDVINYRHSLSMFVIHTIEYTIYVYCLTRPKCIISNAKTVQFLKNQLPENPLLEFLILNSPNSEFSEFVYLSKTHNYYI